jgi:DNA-binding transcriptional MocR family regulator
MSERQEDMSKAQNSWTPKIRNGKGAAYLQIANAIADDVAIGVLTAEQRLPPQRKLAALLGLDFTTVARAYNEAHRRGLVDSVVGRGTFVCGRRRPKVPRAVETRANVDMSMNMPPEPFTPQLKQLMQSGMADVGARVHDLLRYQDFCGSVQDRDAGALWLRRRGMVVDPDRVLVTPGAQCALLAVLASIAGHGSVVCCEELTYPGLRALAAQLGIRLVGLPMDGEGIDAVAFAAACAQFAPKALYCNPTLLNPTGGTISASRRQALVDVARHHDVLIIEDDAYGFLPAKAPPAIATIGPDITFYIAGLSKCIGAGLRVGYLVAPDPLSANRLVAALRATTVMVSPITAAIATRWIRDGTADLALAAIRKESTARQKLAARILPAGCFRSSPEAFHLWIRLPEGWGRTEFAAQMKSSGIGVVASDAFLVGGEPPDAVRICIGGVATREELQHALQLIADNLTRPPMSMPAVV